MIFISLKQNKYFIYLGTKSYQLDQISFYRLL